MDSYTSIVGFFQDGGFFMYPIALVFAAGLAVAIERYVYLSKTSVSNQMLWKKITPFIQSGKFAEAASVTSKSGAAIGSILTLFVVMQMTGRIRWRHARRRNGRSCPATT